MTSRPTHGRRFRLADSRAYDVSEHAFPRFVRSVVRESATFRRELFGSATPST